MDEVTAGARFGLLKATSLSESLGHDMAVLAEVFTHIAPTVIAPAVHDLSYHLFGQRVREAVDEIQ